MPEKRFFMWSGMAEWVSRALLGFCDFVFPWANRCDIISHKSVKELRDRETTGELEE